MDSVLGPCPLDVPEAAASPRARASRGLREDLCALARRCSFRDSADEANRLWRRRPADALTPGRVARVVRAEGEAIMRAKSEAASRLVRDDAGDGEPRSDAPGDAARAELLTIVAATAAGTATAGEDDLASAEPDDPGELREGEGEPAPSEPYAGGCPGKRRRRGPRSEVAPGDKLRVAESYIAWLNGTVEATRRIAGPVEVELDSSQCVYVGIDAVLVKEQCAERVRGGKPQARDGKTYVKHWDARIEADGASHTLTTPCEGELYRQLKAAIAENGLGGRRLVFVIDGETRIHDMIELHFSGTDHVTYLDWHHLQEKIYQYMSSICTGRRLPDPDEVRQVYVRGPKKGQPKPPRHQSPVSRLYAKQASLIAWSGNVGALLDYVRNMPGSDVKSERARQELIAYIERKSGWMPCYSLRKRLGLRNSSNGAELANQQVVSQRQKSSLMSWRESGSASLAAVTALFVNGEERGWFDSGRVGFAMGQPKAA